MLKTVNVTDMLILRGRVCNGTDLLSNATDFELTSFQRASRVTIVNPTPKLFRITQTTTSGLGTLTERG
jgi:hypothetical protein